jgi:DNA invertase Pin-like site-specific DNA recombinase
MKQNGNRVAVYLRVSSRSQRVASQRREVQRYLDGHGITDARWFVDDGVSGKDLNRPALRELNEAVFHGEVDTIVLYKLDRLARSIYDGITLLHDWIAQHGVRVVITTMQLDLSGALGQTVAALLLGLAQMEREHIRERQAAGIAAARAAGRNWGGRPKGSTKVPVSKVCDLRDRGLAHSEIAQALGVHPRTVGRLLGTCRN